MSSQLAVGPLGAAFLGELGAEVIKVEVPDGDLIRTLLPHMNGVATYYTSVNVNKKNIALDLKNPRDLEIARGLAERSDVFRRELPAGRDGAPRPRLRGRARAQSGHRLLLLLRVRLARPSQARGQRRRLRARLHGVRQLHRTGGRAGGALPQQRPRRSHLRGGRHADRAGGALRARALRHRAVRRNLDDAGGGRLPDHPHRGALRGRATRPAGQRDDEPRPSPGVSAARTATSPSA